VAVLLDINEFEVFDLGVDVPVENFVKAAKEFKPEVVGLSCLLTGAYEPMKKTIAALREDRSLDEVKVMIGGAAIDSRIRDYVQADAWGKDAVEAATLCKRWMAEDR